MTRADEQAIAEAAERIHAARRRAEAEREKREAQDALSAAMAVLPKRAYGARLQLLAAFDDTQRRPR